MQILSWQPVSLAVFLGNEHCGILCSTELCSLLLHPFVQCVLEESFQGSPHTCVLAVVAGRWMNAMYVSGSIINQLLCTDSAEGKRNILG